MKLIAIGTGNNVHLRLNSPFVSGYHAEILMLDNGEIFLTDKGSKNGTFLNDQRLLPNKDIPVKRGDMIRFADIILDWQNVPTLSLPDRTKIKEMCGIGTNFRNKFQLQNDKVSRFHATLTKKNDNKWYIQDHSKNGTTVNGERIPSNQDIKLKKGDKISCAGVPVANPYGEGSSVNYRKMFMALSLVLFLCGGFYGISRWVRPGFSEDRIMTDEEIYAKYKNSAVLLCGSYYYNITAGNLPLEKYDLPTKVILEGNRIQNVDGNNSKMKSFTGTGFFISDDGKIATNLHVARPWLFDKEVSLISDKYKMEIAEKASQYPALNAFISQVKVEGVLSYLGMLPNGAYLSVENLKQCRELVGHDNTENDVAILQLETKSLPDPSCTIVNLDHAVIDDSDISVGSHIYTMGFPHGMQLQDIKSTKGLQLFGQNGNITQECTEYTFGFNAPSYHGASGSPVFNDKGQLIGVLNSGVRNSQGFNYAVKAVHVKELYDKTLSK